MLQSKNIFKSFVVFWENAGPEKIKTRKRNTLLSIMMVLVNGISFGLVQIIFQIGIFILS